MERSREDAVRDVEVNVSYSRSRPGDDVASDLTAAGMHVARVLGRLRVVCGTAAPEALERLAGVEGVRAVERDRPVHPA